MLSDDLLEMLHKAFAEEAKRLLLDFEEELSGLQVAEDGTERRSKIGNLRRTAHTLKGAGRAAEFPEIESVAMALEDKFRSFGDESDQPYLDDESITTLEEVVGFLEKLIDSSQKQSDLDIPSSEIFSTIERIEKLTLSTPQEDEAEELDETALERVRFLVRMLVKAFGAKFTRNNAKKTFQIALSLSGTVEEYSLEVLAPLMSGLETVLRDCSENKQITEWPDYSLCVELLQKYAKHPRRFKSDQIQGALELLGFDASSVQETDDVNSTFLEETAGSIQELRAVLLSAKESGAIDKKKLRVSLMSLTGATRAVDLPLAETLCLALDSSLVKVAGQNRAPAKVLACSEELIKLLELEVEAFGKGQDSVDSKLALSAVERLEAATEEEESAPEEDFVEKLKGGVSGIKDWIKLYRKKKAKLPMLVTRLSELSGLCQASAKQNLGDWFAKLENLAQAWVRDKVAPSSEQLKLLTQAANLAVGSKSKDPKTFASHSQKLYGKLSASMEKDVPVEVEEMMPRPGALHHFNFDKAESAVQASSQLFSVLGYLSHRDRTLEEMEESLYQWRENIAENHDLVMRAARRGEELTVEEKEQAFSLLRSQADYIQNFESQFSTWKRGAFLAQRMATDSIRECQAATVDLLQIDSSSLLELMNPTFAKFQDELVLTSKVESFEWDERLWAYFQIERSLDLCLQHLVSLGEKANCVPEVEVSVKVKDGTNLDFDLTCVNLELSGDPSVDSEITEARDLLVAAGGRLRLLSGDGASRYLITVPKSLPQQRAVFFEAGEQVFALPTTCVHGVEISEPERLDAETVEYHEVSWKIQRLGPIKTERAVIYVQGGGKSIALVGSKILGEEEISPVRLRAPFRHDALLPFTASFSGDGRAALFLDPEGSLSLVPTDGPWQEEEKERPSLLVAEDFAAARLMFEVVLGYAGYDVTTTNTGVEALELLKDSKSSFQAVLSDIDMPEMDGFQLCKAIKDDPGLSSLPFLLISTLDTVESRQKGKDAGADAYVSKERFQSDKLIKMLSEILPVGETV